MAQNWRATKRPKSLKLREFIKRIYIFQEIYDRCHARKPGFRVRIWVQLLYISRPSPDGSDARSWRLFQALKWRTDYHPNCHPILVQTFIYLSRCLKSYRRNGALKVVSQCSIADYQPFTYHLTPRILVASVYLRVARCSGLSEFGYKISIFPLE